METWTAVAVLALVSIALVQGDGGQPHAGYSHNAIHRPHGSKEDKSKHWKTMDLRAMLTKSMVTGNMQAMESMHPGRQVCLLFTAFLIGRGAYIALLSTWVQAQEQLDGVACLELMEQQWPMVASMSSQKNGFLMIDIK
ncbi:hypothetical protein CAPTEDRAFT_204516 [Capitella teleta]|uniref:Uncharacterized protein n=1 Tax=Capitella teleta TaxID=283909 RepID=R7U3X0_CAPTE|nr:hypothetical protein CAPTEDRAFT_204516 [Capitella teleta]|eukprot:ELT98361.1 hypothetical protein CAPTEDRAFT_204516 [Capitella teleta]